MLWGAWVAQSVERLTLDFSSGHDLTVCGFEPHICAVSMEPRACFGSISLKYKRKHEKKFLKEKKKNTRCMVISNLARL